MQRLQHGGRLLGQGVYGCTFDPAPACSDGKTVKTLQGLPAVGKLTVEESDAELAVGREIMRLPLAAQYFALPTVGCRPATPVRDSDAQDCKVLTAAGTKTKLSMLLMPAAGEQLLAKAEDLQWLAQNFKRTFVHLLEGMLIYQGAGWTHNDIHMGNVLVDERGVARYIDFGLAFRPADVARWEDSQLSRTFRPKSYWQAPEVHCWRMRLAGLRLEDGIAELKRNIPELERIEHQMPRPRMEETMSAFFREDRTVAGRDDVGFLRTYGARFDWWRIGLCFWMLWNDLLRWPPFAEEPLYKRERDVVRRVLAGMTQFDPRVRMGPLEALKLLDPGNLLASGLSSARPATGKA